MRELVWTGILLTLAGALVAGLAIIWGTKSELKKIEDTLLTGKLKTACVNGTKDDVLSPHLVLSMATGRSSKGPVQTSMSEDAVLMLWDKVSSSIQVRPPGEQQLEKAEVRLAEAQDHLRK